MDYSDDYLRGVLPEQDPPSDFVPPEVDEEIAGWIERVEMVDRGLIARSTRWTYAIANELRLNQIKLDWRDYPPWAFHNLSLPLAQPLAIGVFDPATEGKHFGLILHVPPSTHERSGIVANIRFPRLNVSFPLLLRHSTYEDHLVHPQSGTSAAWAMCNAAGGWGVLTAGHVVRSATIGGSVPLANGSSGLLRRTCYPSVDCAFVSTPPPMPLPALMPTRRFPAAGQKVSVECKTGSVQRTVVEVETNMQVVAIRLYDIKIFLDNELSPGDSGALVRTPTNEAVGVYLGSLTTPAVPTGFAGRALNFEQALFALGVTAYR